MIMVYTANVLIRREKNTIPEEFGCDENNVE